MQFHMLAMYEQHTIMVYVKIHQAMQYKMIIAIMVKSSTRWREAVLVARFYKALP